ncbi:arylsulfatase [Aureibacter tunicatorum]|uniref:Arylsulfatase n=1 Tax=Aureibacter tunicatorum TaxID=866807 RepID=A0AAE3XLB2_9BACT|nr:arylsulfatase [Aureibacter tunicatorum]MDR6238035.1 arylsulfatase [Aureibacter tunicatorum]BDD03068.1 arylsulfatase [Aureibacter tunicatorum]
MKQTSTWIMIVGILIELFSMPVSAAPGPAPKKGKNSKPNILVIFGDDIGITNVSAYSRGLMGYMTPNIDRIAKEGVMFTDYYAEQSCTAGRAAFITGQSPVRTGLTKVGLPGSPVGIQKEDPTIAQLLKPYGYATAQFGKNHFGDRDEFLPTNHGFDLFFGNLYHLNAEEEPEHPDYPQDPEFKKKYGPRGVIRATSDGKIEDTGPLTKKRMETVDKEFLDAAKKWIKEQANNDQHFFTWFNTTAMHFPTYPDPSAKGLSKGQGFYADVMVQHDNYVGELLDLLDELGIADNTIVIYTTDNGPHFNMWPDGAISPFRGEKNTNWEGGYRVPCMVRWPGKFPAGIISNEIVSHMDWTPTLVAAAGNDKVKQELLTGFQADGETFKVHLDGYNLLPYLTGDTKESPRTNFFYFSDDGLPVGMRTGDWKLVFAEQRAHGFAVWAEPFVQLRLPHILNLRRDPFERAPTDANNYEKFRIDHAFMVYKGQDEFAQFLATFQKYPVRQRPASFSVDQIAEKFLKPDLER